MPRSARQASESGYYHVSARGVGKRFIYEGDSDRSYFVGLLEKLSAEMPLSILAWALMDNHYHLLCRCCSIDGLAAFMRKLNTAYAQHFNGSHGHIGHVFQGRYSSVPVETDSHLIATLRYIHLNPLDAGIRNLASYPWTSYPQYLGRKGFCDIDTVKSILGDEDAIRKIHEGSSSDAIVPLDGYRARLSDAEAFDLVRNAYGPNFPDCVGAMKKDERDRAIARMHRIGLSAPQIERLTGVSRMIAQRACKNALLGRS